MTFEKNLILKFAEWLTPDELEVAFWAASDDLHENRCWYATQHANRPAGKLRDEILPILLFSKFINGQQNGVGNGFRVRCNVSDEKHDGNKEFDAEFRWENFQPNLLGDKPSGYLEVTRCTNAVPEEMEHNKLLAEGIIPDSEVRNCYVSDEYKDLVIAAINKKVQKKYPKNTTLILSLDDFRENTNAAYWLEQDIEFMKTSKQIASKKFQGLFFCGMSAGLVYLNLNTSHRPT